MVYTRKEDKESIRIQFEIYLLKNGFKFKSFCNAKGLEYEKEYHKLKVGNLHHDNVMRWLKMINPKARLLSSSQGFVITDK